MDRSEFITAIVAEMRRQKAEKGNEENFFTGLSLSSFDVYRKLCFDYPVIDNDMLELFLNGIQQYESSSDEFTNVFTLNEKMLYNLTTLHGKHDQERDQEPAVHQRQQELLCCISTELYLRFPCLLADWPLGQVLKVLEIEQCSVDQTQIILERYKRIFTNLNISQISGSINLQYLSEGRHLVRLTGVVEKFISMYSLSAATGIRVKQLTNSNSLLDLILCSNTDLSCESLQEELSYRSDWLKDMIVHFSNVCLEIIAVFPELLVDFFPEYFRVLSIFKHNSDPFSSDQATPTISEYLLLLAVNRISSILNDKTMSAVKLKPAVDSIRLFFHTYSNLSQLVDVCMLIQELNLPPMDKDIPRPSAILDLESAGFIVDLTLLLLNSESSVVAIADKYSSSSLADVIVASRLLTSLLNVYVALVSYYIQSSNTNPIENPDNKRIDAQLWSLSVKSNLALVRLIMLDNKIPLFVSQYSSFINVFHNLTAHLRSGFISSASSAWRPMLGVTVLFALVLKHCMAISRSPSSAGIALDTSSLIALVLEGQTFTRIEIQRNTHGVINQLLQQENMKERRDEADVETELKHGEAAEPSGLLPVSSVQAYIRTLEAVDSCCQMLLRNDLPVVLTLLKRDKSMEMFFRTFLVAWSQLIRALNSGKNQLSQSTKDSQQMLANSYERTIRSCKSLLSILDGGSTSKSD